MMKLKEIKEEKWKKKQRGIKLIKKNKKKSFIVHIMTSLPFFKKIKCLDVRDI